MPLTALPEAVQATSGAGGYLIVLGYLALVVLVGKTWK